MQRISRQKAEHRNIRPYTSTVPSILTTINELTSRKSGKTAVTSLKVNGVSITNPTELSNEFNNHFATIGPELSRNIDSPDGDVYQRYITSTDQCFQLRPTSVNKVFSLLNNDIICKYQSGFRAIHSSVTALLEVTDSWAYNIDRGKINAVVFQDLKKAFDTVDHEILL